MKKIIMAGAMLLANPVNALTVDETRFFAYLFHPDARVHITLSHERCPLKGDAWQGYAQITPDLTGKAWDACWGSFKPGTTIVKVCPVSIKDDTWNSSGCLLISEEYFVNVKSLPVAAF